MAPPHAQLLIRGFDGRTCCLDFGARALVPAAEVFDAVAAAFRLPAAAVRLAAGCGLLPRSGDLRASAGLLPTCALVLPLCGGKGGFGANLRGAGKGGRILANDNLCRDLSGRRMKDVNAEKKMQAWEARCGACVTQPYASLSSQAAAKERELEAVAEAHLKRARTAAARGEEAAAAATSQLAQVQKEESERLAGSLERGLAEAQRAREAAAARRAAAAAAAAPPSLWALWGAEEEDSEGEEEEEEEAPAKRSRGPAAEPAHARAPEPAPVAEAEPAPEPSPAPAPEPVAPRVEAPPAPAAAASAPAAAAAAPLEPLDWSRHDSAASLEALGLAELKERLSSAGLKCGGSLAERAARLFLLKHCAPAAIDAKHRKAK